MKVFVVECAYPYETSIIEKVFATREAADVYANARSVEYGCDDLSNTPFCVSEFDVDGMPSAL